MSSRPLPQRFIAHLDMDAFYASVELLRYPELRGLPVVIGGGRQHAPVSTIDPATGVSQRRYSILRGYVGRGVITTATYEARALGLRSAMGLMKAAALAPDTILLPVDFDSYRQYSRRFKAAVMMIASQIEDRGIDEIYIDLTDLAYGDDDPWWRARDLARAIKDAVREATGLSCSIGIAPNKLLAKIASDLDKPNGLTLISEADIPERIWPLPAKRINGVGPKANDKLQSLGIKTIGELARAEPLRLAECFGRNYAVWLLEVAQGHDLRPVQTHSEPKSISRETTFERDLSVTRDKAELTRIFTALCVGLSEDLRRKGYAGQTVGLKLRYDNFKTVTRDQRITAPTADALAIRRAAGECLKRVPLDRRIRLLGVRVGSLVPLVANTAADAVPCSAGNAKSTTPSLF